MDKKTSVWTTVIIDDEKPARESLKAILKMNFPEFEIIGEADSVKTGVDLLNTLQPDLVFLDINLSDGSGFNLLERLENVSFRVIFVTAYDNYAISAFKVNALDYIMKPVGIESLKILIKKIIKLDHSLSKEELQMLRVNWRKDDLDSKKLVIREMDGIRYLKIKDVLRCQSHNNYTEIHMKNGDRFMTSRTLKEYTGILIEYGFYRIFQSHLVNLSMIKKIINRDGLFVEMDSGDILELSRGKKIELLKIMQDS